MSPRHTDYLNNDDAADDANDDDNALASNNPAVTVPASQTLSRRQNAVPTLSSQGNKPPRNSNDGPSTSTTSSQPTLHPPPAPPPPPPPQNPATPTKHDRGWRRITRNFSPSWFSTTMGTGVLPLLFSSLTLLYPTATSSWLYWIAIAFLCLNCLLFTLAFLISVLRYTLYPEIWTVMVRDPTNSLFLGTIPMGFATLVSGWTLLCVPHWGKWSLLVAWGCWMLDTAVAVGVTVALPFMLMSESHQQGLERITAVQLLPIASTIVASATGVNVSAALVRVAGWEGRALGTLVACYVLWGMSIPMAFTVLVIYYQRLCLHKLPSREIIVSSFLPLGPLGMGGYAIMRAGVVAREVFPKTGFLMGDHGNGGGGGTTMAGEVAFVLGVFVALVMWGFGLVWLAFAVAAIAGAEGVPFNMGWWGYTFPLGVYSLSTIYFGLEMPSLFFRVLGTIGAVAVLLLWLVVAAGTARGAWKGHLFYAPCLRNLKPSSTPEGKEVDREEQKDAEKAGGGGPSLGAGGGVERHRM